MVSLVPKLRIKLTRFHGVLAPNSMYRTLDGAFSHYALCLIKLNTARVNSILRKLLDKRSIIADALHNKVDNAMNFKFDEMISAPCRLGILATLVPGAPVSFTAMKAATSLSDGNLHVQTRKLADVGYIKISKIMKGRRTVTEFRITKLGRDRLQHHIMTLQKILDMETDDRGNVRHSNKPDDSMVWA